MIIPIKREDGVLQEWVIIELQGDLSHSSGNIENSSFIGDLHFTKEGTPILIIGVHVLSGKETALPKPFAVLKRMRRKINGEAIEGRNIEESFKTEYVVKALVKKKLIFKGRPKPIVTGVPISH
ncbi:chromosome transmission fidelity protein 8 homolog [Venturia canescens]|uniref:chromosome transmission fidelity protein 8 homolog n=1 Tax=Venturia canescens TaxID=32260 RepID=UPI001C9BD6B1|nr:chromosome transmission fidelity protein 8 homolog [Venturia canescens]